MGKKTKQNQVTELIQENSNKTKTVEATPTPVQHKAEKKEQVSKQTKDDGNKQEANEQQNQKVQLFGLYFHSQKVLNTFLIFALGMIIVPVSTYFICFNYLEKIPEITKNQAQMYSGFVSVGVVLLFMIGYCVVAITDENNFKYEQSEYEKLSEKEKKELSKEKITEAFEETALEHGIREVVRKKNNPVENQDPQKKFEAPKQEVKKEETKNQKKEEPKNGGEKQQSSTTQSAKGKEKQGKAEPKKENKGQAGQKKEITQQAVATTSQAKAAATVKVANDSSNDEWNVVVKDKRNPTKPANNEESEQPSGHAQKEKVQTSESEDAFIPVTKKKKK
ncbi:hypothetical protein ABPG72_011781 [Tetrahymena utriculariae]